MVLQGWKERMYDWQLKFTFESFMKAFRFKLKGKEAAGIDGGFQNVINGQVQKAT